MRINLHTNLYDNTTFEANKRIRKKKQQQAPKEIQVIDIRRKPDEINPIYENGFDDGVDFGYDIGYQEAKAENKFIVRAGMFVLTALSALNLFENFHLGTMMDLNTAELNQKIESTNTNLTEQINDARFETYIDDKALLATMVDIMLQLQEMQEQENTLEEKINSLPQDSKEAQELKEELETLKEQYNTLEEKYQDYMSEYQKENQGNEDSEGMQPNENRQPNDDIPIPHGQTIYINA